MGMGEGNRVEVADAARPENFRDDFFANVKILRGCLRGLARASAKAAAIDEEGFSVGGDKEQRVALAYVDGFKEQGVTGMVDGTGENGGEGGEKKRGPGCE
jgi:hypothetical protein